MSKTLIKMHKDIQPSDTEAKPDGMGGDHRYTMELHSWDDAGNKIFEYIGPGYYNKSTKQAFKDWCKPEFNPAGATIERDIQMDGCVNTPFTVTNNPPFEFELKKAA